MYSVNYIWNHCETLLRPDKTSFLSFITLSVKRKLLAKKKKKEEEDKIKQHHCYFAHMTVIKNDVILQINSVISISVLESTRKLVRDKKFSLSIRYYL